MKSCSTMSNMKQRLETALKSLHVQLDHLLIFTFLWAVQTFFNQVEFIDWAQNGDILGVLVTVSALLVILRPKSLLLFSIMVSLNIIDSMAHLPQRVNHRFFEDIVNVTILAALLLVFYRHWRTKSLSGGWFALGLASDAAREQVFQVFAPVGRIQLVLLYFFATFGKLNSDFLNPEYSCGSLMYLDILDTYPIPQVLQEVLSTLSPLAVWGTVLIEGSMALLLFFKPTRLFAIVLGILFHYGLSFHVHTGIYGFSAMLYAMYVLFTPAHFPNVVASILNRLIERLSLERYYWLYALIGLASSVGMVWVFRELAQRFWPDEWWFLWITWATAFTLMALYVVYRTYRQKSPITEPNVDAISARWLWMFAVFVLLNGVMPYVGLKTSTSMTMFSNLRTEDRITNHLFVPANLHVADYQQGLVKLLDVTYEAEPNVPRHMNLQLYFENNWKLTYFEFERRLYETDVNVVVEYQRNGEIHTATNQARIVENTLDERVYTPFLGQVLYFRHVPEGGVMKCGH